MKKYFKNQLSLVGGTFVVIGVIWLIIYGGLLGFWFNPIAILLMFVGLICFAIGQKRAQTFEMPYSKNFDERQRMVRGKVFTHGFFLFALVNFIGISLLTLDYKMSRMVFIGGFCLVFFIVLGELILRGAYQKRGVGWAYHPLWYVFYIFIGLLNFLLFRQSLRLSGTLDFNSFTQLFASIIWFEIGILSSAKYLWDKKH